MASWFSISQWSTRVKAGIGGLTAIVLSWGMSVFESSKAPVQPTLAAGQPVEAGQWTLRLDRVDISDRAPGGLPRAGRKTIVLYLQANNRTTTTSNSFMQAVKLDTPLPGLDARPTAYLMRDRAILADLQPALPEAMALVWTLPADTPVPDSLRFSVHAMRYKPVDNLYAQPLWSNPQLAGIVDLQTSHPESAGPT